MFMTDYLKAKLDLWVKYAELTGDYSRGLSEVTAIKEEARETMHKYMDSQKAYIAINKKSFPSRYYIEMERRYTKWYLLYSHASTCSWKLRSESIATIIKGEF